MTALTENRYTKHRDGLITAHPVKASTKIFKGSLICVDNTGFAVPGNDWAGLTFVGIAIENADNSAGSDGSTNVRVQTMGVFSFAKGGLEAQCDVGSQLYIMDDQTITASSTLNLVDCGRLEGLDGSDLWVRI